MKNENAKYTPQTEEKIEALLKRVSSAASDAEQQAYNAFQASLAIKNLLPCAKASDCGKILGVGNTDRLIYKTFSEVYEQYHNIFTDVGAESDYAYITINEDVLLSMGIDGTSKLCTFGFGFMPDASSPDKDIDVLCYKAERVPIGIKLYFSVDICPLFKEIETLFELKKHFEQIRLCGEYPVYEKGAKWISPEEVFSPSFLEQNIISPAVFLSKEYINRNYTKFPKPKSRNTILCFDDEGNFAWQSKEELFDEMYTYLKSRA